MSHATSFSSFLFFFIFLFWAQTLLINPLLIIQHTRFWDHSMGRADVSLGVMRLYQKDLAEQCWIGRGKSGFQLSPYFMLGNLKRRLKAPQILSRNPPPPHPLFFFSFYLVCAGQCDPRDWYVKSSTKAKIIVIEADNKAGRGGRKRGHWCCTTESI